LAIVQNDFNFMNTFLYFESRVRVLGRFCFYSIYEIYIFSVLRSYQAR